MPVNAAPNSRPQDPERLGSLLIGLFVALALLGILLWWKCHTQIAVAVLALQDVELDLIGLFTHRYDGLHANLHEAVPAQVSAGTLWALCTITGSVLRWPVLILILGLAALCFTRAPRELYRKRFGLDGLQEALAAIHPLGAAWLGKGMKLVAPAPADEPLRPLDPALKRSEWIERYATGATLDDRRRAAEQALVAQLGSRWNGIENASTAEKTLFLSFALFAQRRKEEAQAVLEALSASLAGSMRNGAPSAQLRANRRFEKELDKQLSRESLRDAVAMAEQHAWTRPVLLTLLQHARLRAGVVNPGIFAVIQLLDRDLWLVLSAASYPRDGLPFYVMAIAPCPEAAAALAHWKAECLAGKPLAQPNISSIVKTLEPA